MTQLPMIWGCLQTHLLRDVWIDLDDIYALVARQLVLDEDDFRPQSPSSPIPKWKRNVRSVLQYRKGTGEIDWNRHASYRLRSQQGEDTQRAQLTKAQLLSRIIAGVHAAGWQVLILERAHPFLLRVFKPNASSAVNLRIAISNCTQPVTDDPDGICLLQPLGDLPDPTGDDLTLILAWQESFGVFVGVHSVLDRSSAETPIALRSTTLMDAHRRGLCVGTAESGLSIVCFRPEFLMDYALNIEPLHRSIEADDESVTYLNRLPHLDDSEVENHIADVARRELIVTLRRRFRQYDFRKRVLNAYLGTCAFCGVQLGLVEAAHIVPVAASRSSDKTDNGVALCALHHRAFDQNLVSFDEDYHIEISTAAIGDLADQRLSGELEKFRNLLRESVLLPIDRRDYPARANITDGRRVRAWQP